MPSRQFLSQAGAAATPMTIRPSSHAPPAVEARSPKAYAECSTPSNKHRQVRPRVGPRNTRCLPSWATCAHRMVHHLHDHFGPKNQGMMVFALCTWNPSCVERPAARTCLQESPPSLRCRPTGQSSRVSLRKTGPPHCLFSTANQDRQPRRQVEKIFIGPQLMRTGIVFRSSQPRKIATPQK